MFSGLISGRISERKSPSGLIGYVGINVIVGGGVSVGVDVLAAVGMAVDVLLGGRIVAVIGVEDCCVQPNKNKMPASPARTCCNCLFIVNM